MADSIRSLATGDHEPEWVSPANYPYRCSEERALNIARMVLRGATLAVAAMANGVAPSRVRQWMRWGAEAYERNATPEDSHAAYLNLFLKVMQAYGLAGAPVQAELRVVAPQWWLVHHPELRSEWGGDAPETALLSTPVVDPSAETTVDADAHPVTAPLTNEQLAAVLTQMSEIQAINKPPAPLKVVDAIPPRAESEAS